MLSTKLKSQQVKCKKLFYKTTLKKKSLKLYKCLRSNNELTEFSVFYCIFKATLLPFPIFCKVHRYTKN